MAGTLILVRHGQSEWNLKNLFTGWKNPELTEQGIEEARKAGVEQAMARRALAFLLESGEHDDWDRRSRQEDRHAAQRHCVSAEQAAP